MWSHRICAASAGSARPPISPPTRIFDTVGDMVALVAALGETQAVIVGHDWGAPVAWHAALFRPDIFTAVAGLSVPPPFRGRGRPLDSCCAKTASPISTGSISRHPALPRPSSNATSPSTMRIVLAAADLSDPAASLFVQEGKGFLGDAAPIGRCRTGSSEADLAYFAEAYRKSGFPRRAELVSQHRPQLGADRALAGRADPPALPVHRGRRRMRVITGLIGAKRVNELERVLPNLRRKLIIDGAGHWIQQERPDEVNAALIAFIKESSLLRVESQYRPAPASKTSLGPARIDRRIGRSSESGRPGIARVILVGDRARILEHPSADASGSRPTFPRSH